MVTCPVISVISVPSKIHSVRFRANYYLRPHPPDLPHDFLAKVFGILQFAIRIVQHHHVLDAQDARRLI